MPNHGSRALLFSAVDVGATATTTSDFLDLSTYREFRMIFDMANVTGGTGQFDIDVESWNESGSTLIETVSLLDSIDTDSTPKVVRCAWGLQTTAILTTNATGNMTAEGLAYFTLMKKVKFIIDVTAGTSTGTMDVYLDSFS